MVFITSYISGQRKTFIVRPQPIMCVVNAISCDDIFNTILEKEGSCLDVFLTCEGKPVTQNDIFKGNINVVATLRLQGGKGGFGSMLRAIGAQIEKTTNREACRDLSGRRLRDINEEKRLKDFLAKKVEKEKEMLKVKRKKLEQLKEGTKHVFEDKSYFEQREKRERDVFDSLDKAFSSTAEGSKPLVSKSEGSQPPKKVLKKRMMDDLDDSSEEEDSEDDDDDDSTKAKGRREEDNAVSGANEEAASTNGGNEKGINEEIEETMDNRGNEEMNEMEERKRRSSDKDEEEAKVKKRLRI